MLWILKLKFFCFFRSAQQGSQMQTPPRQPDFDSTTPAKGQKSANSGEKQSSSSTKSAVNENEVQVWLKNKLAQFKHAFLIA